MQHIIDKNNKDIQVSVYCLAYNHEKYIQKTLEGFVNQIADFKFEVFVHDDASTDHTPEIIKRYADEYPDIIKPIFQQENQFSKGVKICATHIYPKMQGKYIASCEGDDYWIDPQKLQKQFDLMETHPECSLSVHKVLCCNEDGSSNAEIIPGKQYRLTGSRVIKEQELAECYWVRGAYPFHTSSYFYRRNIINVDLDYPRDIGTLRKCLIKGWVYYIDEPMSVRRLWSIGNWNSTINSKGVQGWYKLMLQDNEAEERFDHYTNYKYHGFIEVNRLIRFIHYAQYGEYYDEIKQLLKKYNLSPWKVRKRISAYMFFELQIKYWLAIYAPKFYFFIIKCWRFLCGCIQKMK